MQTLTSSKSDIDRSFEAPAARVIRSSVLGGAVVASLAALLTLAAVPGTATTLWFWLAWVGFTVACVVTYAVGSIVYRHASGQSRRTQRWLKGR